MTRFVEHLTLDFDSGHDPRVVALSPSLGSTLTAQRLLGILSLSLSSFLCPSPPLSFSCVPSLSKIKLKDLFFFLKWYFSEHTKDKKAEQLIADMEKV